MNTNNQIHPDTLLAKRLVEENAELKRHLTVALAEVGRAKVAEGEMKLVLESLAAVAQLREPVGNDGTMVECVQRIVAGADAALADNNKRLRDAIISAISDLSDAREHNLTAMLESDDPDGNAEEFARFAVEHAAKAIATMRAALRPAPTESKEDGK